MNEVHWLTNTEPGPMLAFLAGGTSDRKFRLFACACCHRIKHMFTDEYDPAALAIIERFADGRASLAELDEIQNDTSNPAIREAAGPSALTVAMNTAAICVAMVGDLYGEPNHPKGLGDYLAGDGGERKAQCRLIREIFGNPFHPVEFDPNWCSSTARALAAQIDQSLDFNPMPILADALQDAGCNHLDVLGHLRGPGPHVRGCWVVDLLLHRP